MWVLCTLSEARMDAQGEMGLREEEEGGKGRSGGYCGRRRRTRMAKRRKSRKQVFCMDHLLFLENTFGPREW